MNLYLRGGPILTAKMSRKQVSHSLWDLEYALAASECLPFVYSSFGRALTLPSFAYVEMSLLLAKIFFRYELELVNKNFDLERESHMHVMWWKPSLKVRVKDSPKI